MLSSLILHSQTHILTHVGSLSVRVGVFFFVLLFNKLVLHIVSLNVRSYMYMDVYVFLHIYASGGRMSNWYLYLFSLTPSLKLHHTIICKITLNINICGWRSPHYGCVFVRMCMCTFTLHFWKATKQQ